MHPDTPARPTPAAICTNWEGRTRQALNIPLAIHRDLVGVDKSTSEVLTGLIGLWMSGRRLQMLGSVN